MKLSLNYIILLIVYSCVSIVYGQKIDRKSKRQFLLKVDSLNQMMTEYDTLSPFGDDNELGAIDYLGSEIPERLINVLNSPEMKLFKVQDLFPNQSGYINASDDGKLSFFGVDEKMGGTYRPYFSLVYYQIDDTTRGLEILGESVYSCLDVLDSLHHYYLVSSHLFTCQTCVEESMMIFSFKNNELMIDEFYNFSGRYFDANSNYDSEQKIFTVEETSPHPDDTLYGEEEDDESSESIYRYKSEDRMEYIEGRFVLTKSCKYIVTE